jgi:hypothetical protein
VRTVARWQSPPCPGRDPTIPSLPWALRGVFLWGARSRSRSHVSHAELNVEIPTSEPIDDLNLVDGMYGG